MKKVTLISNELNKEVNRIVENNFKVESGTIGGFSIEVSEDMPVSYSSYIYKNEEDRDSDMKTIEELLSNK